MPPVAEPVKPRSTALNQRDVVPKLKVRLRNHVSIDGIVHTHVENLTVITAHPLIEVENEAGERFSVVAGNLELR